MKYFILLLTIFSVIKLNAQVPSYVPTNGLQGWWPFCGNANDHSSNNRNGTVIGAILTADRFGNANNAYSLNGIANSIFVNDNFFDAGWNEFTISGWYNFNVLTNTNNFNVNQTLINTSPHNGLGISSNWGGTPKHGMLAGNGTPATSWNVLPLIPSTQTITVGAWKHFVYTKSGLNYSFYIDGVLDKTTTASISVSSYLYKMYFGNTDPATINEGVLGKIDDYGIWNRKLTQPEITALYNGSSPCTAATPTVSIPSCIPTTSLVGWWPFCGNANDESGNMHHGTPVGASLTTDRFGNTNNAYSLNGIANSVFVNDNFFDAGWNEFTISGWYNFNVLTNTNNFNVNQTLINTAPHNGLGISSNWGGTPKHGMLAGNGTPATSWNVLPLITSTQTITVGAWKHFVYTKSGLNYSFYIDGVLDKTTTASISVTSYLYKMYFGGTDPNAANECVSGKIDDYAIWNRKLTQTEITALYNCTASCIPANTVTPTPTISVLPIPNVITPNNDGVNDYIDFIKHVSEKDFDFEIFNRWGLSIMKSNSTLKTTWDGTTTSGQQCVNGVYFYIIKTTDKSYKGNISLFR